MNVTIHRDSTRMISSNLWSHSHRFAEIKDTSLDNYGTLDCNNNPVDTCQLRPNYDLWLSLNNDVVRDVLKTGKEFANNYMKEIERDTLNNSFDQDWKG